MVSCLFMRLIRSVSEGSAGLGVGHRVKGNCQWTLTWPRRQVLRNSLLKHKSVARVRISNAPAWAPLGNKWGMCRFLRAVLGTLCCGQRAFLILLWSFLWELSRWATETALRSPRHGVVGMSLFGTESKPNSAPVGLLPDEHYPLGFFPVLCFFLIPVAVIFLALTVRRKKWNGVIHGICFGPSHDS